MWSRTPRSASRSCAAKASRKRCSKRSTLTKTPGESRIEAARRAAAHPLARVVKLADVSDNMDLSRIAQPTEKDYARLREYEQVRALLLAAEVEGP